jgi:selenide,water dikinase
VEKAVELAEEVETLLYDPQTSGGLLISMPETDADWFERACDGAYRVGRVLPRKEKPIRLI